MGREGLSDIVRDSVGGMVCIERAGSVGCVLCEVTVANEGVTFWFVAMPGVVVTGPEELPEVVVVWITVVFGREL